VTEPHRSRIVVGVDGSPGSKAALRWAAQLAGQLGARLDVVGVWEYPPLFGVAALPELEFPAADIERSLNETVEEVLGTGRPADLRVKALSGPPAATLVTAGQGALMIVVGSRGRGGFAGLLLGSVSAKTAEHATCPVLVVHGDGPDDRRAR
jgi:nucleotide-binding universal stress UspA family protein